MIDYIGVTAFPFVVAGIMHVVTRHLLHYKISKHAFGIGISCGVMAGWLLLILQGVPL